MSTWTNTVLAATALAALIISPASAFQPPAVPLPEPEILSVFAASGSGAFGIYLVRKWFKRK